MKHQGNYYLIKHLQLFTGLTERTIRNHMASGFLEGEKIEGMWHFTPEQVEKFIYHPAVRPGILAKHNSLVYDHLLDTGKTQETACVILDVPGGRHIEIAEFFSYTIPWNSLRDVRFYYDAIGDLSRIILTGNAEAVFCVIRAYREAFPVKEA